jgi:hypothetical protein
MTDSSNHFFLGSRLTGNHDEVVVLWVVSIIVMAIGLGFAVSSRRRDRIDVENQHAETVGSRRGA